MYLQTRRAWIRATLRRCGDAVGVDRVAGALARVLAEPARAIASRRGRASRRRARATRPVMVTHPHSVYARLDEGWDETDVANVLFAGVVEPRREVEAWQRIVSSAKPSRLSRARVVALCEEWLAGVASDALVATEKGVHGGEYEPSTTSSRSSPSPEPRLRRRGRARTTSAFVDVLGRAVDAWATLAEEPTSHRAGGRAPRGDASARGITNGGGRRAAGECGAPRAANVRAVAPGRGVGDVGRAVTGRRV